MNYEQNSERRVEVEVANEATLKGRSLKKKRENVGILKKQGGGLRQSHFFCNLTKWIFACQIPS